MKIAGQIPQNITERPLSASKQTGAEETKLNTTDSFSRTETDNSGIPNLSKIAPASAESSSVKKVSEQCKATHLGTDADGNIKLSGFRWGFKEASSRENWSAVFGDATINPKDVKDAYLVVEPFPPEWVAAHAFMYFEMKDDAKIKSSDGRESNGFVVSMEAALKPGQKYGLIEGMGKLFGSIYQVGSWEDVVQKSCRGANHRLIRHKLNLRPDQKEDLARNSLNEAFKDRTGEFYHTTRNSCFSNQIRILNSALDENQKLHRWLIPGIMFSPTASLPTGAAAVLNFRGLLAPDSPPVITQPDKTLFPDNQTKPSLFDLATRKISDLRTFNFFSSVTGAFAGAQLGSMIMPPGVGILVGGVMGASLGYKASTLIEHNSHFVTEPSEKFNNANQGLKG
ncbi:MAG: DUF4105 domain-containing protein [Firmicutes bacterium]|nr:DUF4105 domain-containing protein [Bacillota bacterium]